MAPDLTDLISRFANKDCRLFMLDSVVELSMRRARVLSRVNELNASLGPGHKDHSF